MMERGGGHALDEPPNHAVKPNTAKKTTRFRVTTGGGLFVIMLFLYSFGFFREHILTMEIVMLSQLGPTVELSG